ncbi:urea transporter [Nocardioides sp. 616]|uniref:urea transporter n=1 Tax=Nocardioides sp. 616 TaxID=2268090 RepID=UPI000CE300CE|nr:urea transporter [Nocardioides sp. 616]
MNASKTSPDLSADLRAMTWRSLCHGVSQIFFQANPWTGLLILAAFAVGDLRMAILAAVGTILSTLAGCLMRVPTEGVALGMQGFNGCLVGAAVYAALGGQAWSYVLTVVGALLCAPVTVFFGWLLALPALKGFNLPSTTAPFCTVASILYAVSWDLHVAGSTKHVTDGAGDALARSFLSNVSEVVLVNSALGGLLILIGLFIASWRVGLAAVMGSAIGSLCALALGETTTTIEEGLAGYSGVLTAIALAVVFHHSSIASWCYAAVGTVITAVVTLLMNDATSFPHYTWPYILTTWVLLVVGARIPALRRT